MADPSNLVLVLLVCVKAAVGLSLGPCLTSENAARHSEALRTLHTLRLFFNCKLYDGDMADKQHREEWKCSYYAVYGHLAETAWDEKGAKDESAFF